MAAFMEQPREQPSDPNLYPWVMAQICQGFNVFLSFAVKPGLPLEQVQPGGHWSDRWVGLSTWKLLERERSAEQCGQVRGGWTNKPKPLLPVWSWFLLVFLVEHQFQEVPRWVWFYYPSRCAQKLVAFEIKILQMDLNIHSFHGHSWPKQMTQYVPWSKLDCIRIFRDGHHSINRNLYTHVQGLPDDGGIIITHMPCFDHGTYDSYLWRHWPWIWLNSPCDFLPSQSGGQIRMWTAASGLIWMTWMPSLCRLWREICGTRLIDLELRIV